MEVFKEIFPLQSYLQEHRKSGKSIGLVPTMGALHKGHLSLVGEALAEADIVVCSVFVNPTQFNNAADLDKYPRTLEDDLKMLETAGCNAVFCPSVEEMYPSLPVVKFDFGNLERVMEGSFRPGHFNGVGVIVSKLFNIVNPDFAYFGQKDLQQYMIIAQMVNDLSFSVKLRRVLIFREESGLAMSSRNRRLSEEAKDQAASIYKALRLCEDYLHRGEELDKLKREAYKLMEDNLVQVEYLEVVEPSTLEPVENVSSQKSVAVCIAAYVEGVRLIDNVIIKLDF
ncbi:pantoate--beta-alanine ligase [Fulvivirga sediminis]|uniref:Pantothenate synthetase n=1 Tax=Fulvivirga sediminis TaxID=2803949 RepID=A0A937F6E5_9BACT|nr:pantoate--beta-alanine ligase [Fulvivirga sediminis]MBL3654928.1 pantoate--beta-alanine ligase [Fulvivirga sediminis]